MSIPNLTNFAILSVEYPTTVPKPISPTPRALNLPGRARAAVPNPCIAPAAPVAAPCARSTPAVINADDVSIDDDPRCSPLIKDPPAAPKVDANPSENLITPKEALDNAL